MAIQKEILQRPVTATVKKIGEDGAVVDAELTGGVGALALGKVGDVMTRAYGPVARAAVVEEETAFGTFVEGKGILVNPGDCAGLSTDLPNYPFDTKTLKKGQVGTFLVSGACVVLCSEVEAIAAAMKVQDVYGYTDKEGDVCEIEVNGFDNDNVESSSK